jgi:LL-diaminopimelate aminotransferase
MSSSSSSVRDSASTPADPRAERLLSLPPFLFNAIDDKKRAAIAAGRDVINLGVGDPDRPTPGFIVDELVAAARDPKNHQYPDNYGTKRLLGAIGSFMRRRFGVSVDPARHVVVTLGGKDGIAHFPLGVLNPGDGAIVFSPAYPVYAQATIMAGGQVRRVATQPDQGWRPAPDALSADLLRSSRLMWLNFPGNPSGASIGVDALGALSRRALDAGLVVASDLAYSEIYFEHGPASCPSVWQTPGADIERDAMIEFHSLSKTFNMTGWRLGFAVGHESLIRALKQVKDNYDSGPFNAVQQAGAAALERYDDPQMHEMRSTYAKRRDLVCAGLRAAGCEVHVPEAGIFVWARCPIERASGKPMNSWRFVERLIDEAAIVTVPGAGFGQECADWVRVSLTRETSRIEEAMTRLASIAW